MKLSDVKELVFCCVNVWRRCRRNNPSRQTCCVTLMHTIVRIICVNSQFKLEFKHATALQHETGTG